MPRKPHRSPEEMYQALKGFYFIGEDDCLIPWNDPIWTLAVEAVNCPYIIKDYLWTYMNENRNGVFNRIHNLPPDTPSRKVLQNSRSKKKKKVKPSDPNWSMAENKTNGLAPFRRSIHLSKKEWDSLGAHLTHYKSRAYEVLESGWADQVYYKIWKELELPCPFAFKSRINLGENEIYLQIRGHCNECQSDIHLYSQSPPTSSGIVLIVSGWDSRDIVHIKRRQLRGTTRQKTATQVSSKSTYMWRAETAHKEMKFGGVEPAFLYSADVLRKAKQQEKDKELNVKPGVAAVETFRDLQKGVEFAASIRDFSENNFFVMYWLPEQVTLNNQFLKKDVIGSISVDATGSFCRLGEGGLSNEVVYLYQAVADFCGKTLPICQMISSRHDANWLAHWMREFLRTGAHPPRQFVSDFSLALLNAGSLAFNEKRLEKYVNDSFHQLTTSSEVHSSEKMCMLRIDIAHLIKLVTRWPCIKGNAAMKNFYVRCVGMLTDEVTLAGFRKTLMDILCVAFSEMDGSEKDSPSGCNSRARLLNRIKSQPDLNIDDEEEDLCVHSNDFEESYAEKKNIDRPIVQFLMETEKMAKSCVKKSGGLNPYFNEDFAKRLIKLCEYFTLWTAVMPYLYTPELRTEYQQLYIASSAKSESYFRTMKDFILGKERERVDKVAVRHLRALSGTMKMEAADQDSIRLQKKGKNVKFEESTEESISIDSVNTSENGNCSEDNQKDETDETAGEELSDHTNNEPESAEGIEYLTEESISCELPKSSQKPNFIGESQMGDEKHIHHPPLSDDDEKKSLLQSRPRENIGKLDKICNESSNFSAGASKRIKNVVFIEDCSDSEDKDSFIKVTRRRVRKRNDSDSDRETSLKNDEKIKHPHKKTNTELLSSVGLETTNNQAEDFSMPNSSPPQHCSTKIDLNSPTIKQEQRQKTIEQLVLREPFRELPINVNAHLNEIENWMGQNKKRGMYVRNCPDIENKLANPIPANKLPLLVNGSSLKIVKTDLHPQLKVIYTCSFDSLAHAVRCGMTDWVLYQETARESRSTFMSFVKKFSEKKPNQELYRCRADLLLPLGKLENNVLNCDLNIGAVADTLFGDEPSVKTKLHCPNCKTDIWKKYATISPNLMPLYENGLNGLQESLDLFTFDRNFKCPGCGENRTIEVFAGCHLVLDIEALQWPLAAFRDGFTSSYTKQFSLSKEIPHSLIFEESEYRLVAAIEHQEMTNTVDHYRCHVRRAWGVWEIHDGMSTKSQSRKTDKKCLTSPKTLHVLFYVKVN